MDLALRDLVSTPDADLPELLPIPGGEFFAGLTGAQQAELGGVRGALVSVPAFQLAKFPVTNGDYARFVAATGRRRPRHWPEGKLPEQLLHHPVVWVSWAAANAYCEWLGAEFGVQFRLPTTLEWEKAARGTDGRRFPWGDDFDPSRCRYKARSAVSVTAHVPAGDSPFGVCDMAGNVREWTATARWDGTAVRGGGFLAGSPPQLWCAREDTIAGAAKASVGFRVALSW